MFYIPVPLSILAVGEFQILDFVFPSVEANLSHKKYNTLLVAFRVLHESCDYSIFKAPRVYGFNLLLQRLH